MKYTTIITLISLPIRWFLYFYIIFPITIYKHLKSYYNNNTTSTTTTTTTNNTIQDALETTPQGAIAITGGRSPYTLDLIRIFSKANYQVHSIETNFVHPFYLSYFSSHVYKRHVIQYYPNVESENYARELGRICAQNNIQLLIPTCEDVMWVSKFKTVILEEYRKWNNNKKSKLIVFVDNFDVMLKLHDKYLFNCELKNMKEYGNWNAPESSLLYTTNDLQNYLDHHFSGFKDEVLDIVLKPAYSRFAAQVMITPTLEQIRSFFKLPQSGGDNIPLVDGPWVAQKYIDGEMLCTYSIVTNGVVQAHTVYIGGVYTNSGGNSGGSIYFENANDPEDVRLFVQAFCNQKKYNGQISFDIIRCKYTGKLYPIECNPRGTSGIHLFRSVNPRQFSKLFFAKNDKSIGDDQHTILTPVNYDAQVGAAMVLSFLFVLRVSSIGDMVQWCKKFLTAKDIMYESDDLLPSVIQFLIVFDGLYKTMRHKISFQSAFTHDIEFNSNAIIMEKKNN
jgi:hypothetical protein